MVHNDKRDTIRVYTQPNCQQCVATKRWLESRGIEFEVEDITDNVREAAKSLGIQQAPIVVVGGETWGGFNPSKLAEAFAE